MFISDSAKNFLLSMMKKHDTHALRIYKEASGWGGIRLGVVLDEPRETDHLQQVNGILMAVEPDIVKEAEYVKIYYKKRGKQQGLSIEGLIHMWAAEYLYGREDNSAMKYSNKKPAVIE